MHLSRQQFHSIHLSFTSEWVRARIYCEWKKYNFFHCNLHQCAIKWMKKMLFFYPHNTRFEIFEWEAKKSVIALKKKLREKNTKIPMIAYIMSTRHTDLHWPDLYRCCFVLHAVRSNRSYSSTRSMCAYCLLCYLLVLASIIHSRNSLIPFQNKLIQFMTKAPAAATWNRCWCCL